MEVIDQREKNEKLDIRKSLQFIALGILIYVTLRSCEHVIFTFTSALCFISDLNVVPEIILINIVPFFSFIILGFITRNQLIKTLKKRSVKSAFVFFIVLYLIVQIFEFWYTINLFQWFDHHYFANSSKYHSFVENHFPISLIKPISGTIGLILISIIFYRNAKYLSVIVKT